MNLHAARLPGRLDARGNLLVLVDQDRSRWDAARIAEGLRQLELSAAGAELTPYHVESAIAAAHARAPSAGQTDWDEIVSLYDLLMRIEPSPVVAFNRAVALAQRFGAARGLEEIARIKDRKRLERYPFYYAAVAEFESRLGRPAKARDSLAEALKLARNPAERRFLREKMSNLASLERRD